MTLYDASGTAAGVASVGGGTPALNIPLAGSGAGSAVSTGSANLNMGSGAGQADGTSTLTGITTAGLLAAGLAVGAALVEGDVHPQGAGTAAGTSLMTGTVAILAGLSETISGVATLTTTTGITYIVSGTISGTGELEADLTTPAAGQADGVGLLSPANATRIRTVRGQSLGSSLMVWIYPLPANGSSTMVGHVVVETHLPAINAIVAPPKAFRWLQLLQRGDLPVYICDNRGPVSPFAVTYTLFQKKPTGAKVQVGPGQRAPVSGTVGEFYAVGRAGEGGQPGNWVIRWEFQRSFGGALQTVEMEFRVLDAVLAADPTDSTVRIVKYGWN